MSFAWKKTEIMYNSHGHGFCGCPMIACRHYATCTIQPLRQKDVNSYAMNFGEEMPNGTLIHGMADCIGMDSVPTCRRGIYGWVLATTISRTTNTVEP